MERIIENPCDSEPMRPGWATSQVVGCPWVQCGSIWYFYAFPCISQLWRKWEPRVEVCSHLPKAAIQRAGIKQWMFQCHFLPNLRHTILPPQRCWASSSEAILRPGLFIKWILTYLIRLFYGNSLSASTLDTNTYDESIFSPEVSVFDSNSEWLLLHFFGI